MLIAEELLLLILDDRTGKLMVAGPRADFGLAGGVLVELVQRGKVDIAGDDDTVKRGRVVVPDSTLTGDKILDDGLLEIVNRIGKRPTVVLRQLKKGLRKTLIARLVDAGVIRAEERKILGIFPLSRWPATATDVEVATRVPLAEALLQGVDPDPRTAALIGLLQAMDATTKVIETDNRRALKRRAKVIADGQWVPDAVRKAIQATESAAAGAVVASTSVATMGG